MSLGKRRRWICGSLSRGSRSVRSGGDAAGAGDDVDVLEVPFRGVAPVASGRGSAGGDVAADLAGRGGSKTLAWDREAAIGGKGVVTQEAAAFAGTLATRVVLAPP